MAFGRNCKGVKKYVKIERERERVLVTGYINARVEDSELEDGVDKFGESGMNEYGRKLIDLCSEKKLRKRKSINLHGQVEWMTVRVYWCSRRKEINFWT